MSEIPNPPINFDEFHNAFYPNYEQEGGGISKIRFGIDNSKAIGFLAADEGIPPLEDSGYCTRFGIPPVSDQQQPTPFNLVTNGSSYNAVPDLAESKTNDEPQRTEHSISSLELLSSYRSRYKNSGKGRDGEEKTAGKLSTEGVIRLAAEKFIKFSTQKVNGYTMFCHPYGSSAFTSLSMEESREVDLCYQLLAAAEKVGRKQFDVGSKFLTRCEWVASVDGTPVERLVFHVAEALRNRIDREINNSVTISRHEQERRKESHLALGSNPSFLACHKVLPFNQVLQFAGIQAMVDHVGMANKIHLIDIHIRSGIQWTALMQALVERNSPVELLRLTALATHDLHEVQETGKRLSSFAQSLSLPFSFQVVLLSDIKDLKEEDLNVQDSEVVVIYCQTILRTMLVDPDHLENLMRVIGKINPRIVVVAEVEVNHNSTSFFNRFTEMFFFYGAYFDCLEDCMTRDNEHRNMIERVHLAQGIGNLVATEGLERGNRSVKISTWRSFFARFGMVEMGLSESALYQANLVLQRFNCGSSCTLEMNGKCLIVGWKGTPLHSLSIWKFV